jgi:hypothetical protein
MVFLEFGSRKSSNIINTYNPILFANWTANQTAISDKFSLMELE